MKFACDAMLHDIAKWLRIAGYNVVYFSSDISDSEILEKLKGRVLLTRDKNLHLKCKNSFYLPNKTFEEKLKTIFKHFNLKRLESRCTVCNALLKKVLRK